MPEIIDMFGRDTAAKNAAIAAFGAACFEVKSKIVDKKDSQGIEVCLTLNGEEVPFSSFINKMIDEYTYQVACAAREMMEDRAQILTVKLQSLQRIAYDMEEDVKREIRHLFPESLTDEDYR